MSVMGKDNLLSASVDEVTFTFVDVETTGLNPHFGDRICEIALLRCRGGHVLDSFQSLVNPGRPISPEASAVNHITDDMVRDAPSFGEVADRFTELILDAVIVAHNAPFDLSFIESQFRLLRLPLIGNLVLDTLRLARRLYSFPSNSLGNVAAQLGIETRDAHRAMGDVLITRRVFEVFLDVLREKGCATLGDVLRFQGGTVPFLEKSKIVIPPVIREAMESGRNLRLRYASASGGETDRLVRPIEVTSDGGALYLVAHCYLRNDQRTFRLDRVVRMTLDEGGEKHSSSMPHNSKGNAG